MTMWYMYFMYEEIYKYGLGFQNSQILNLMNHEFINVFDHNRTILELTFNKAKQQPSNMWFIS